MPFDLTTNYPSWYILLCILLGVAYAGILYFRSNDIHYPKGQKWLRWPLSVGRGITVFLISLLLLNPLLRMVKNFVEKPIIVVATDNSGSIGYVIDSLERGQIETRINDFSSALEEKFEVIRYGFDEDLQEDQAFSSTGKVTNIANAIESTDKLWKGQNIRGMVLLSDGIVNKGVSPEYISSRADFPVHTITVGDTSVRRDVRVDKVRTNTIAYLGNSFPVVVDLSAIKANGERLKVSISDANGVIESKLLEVKGNSYFNSVEFQLTAERSGAISYTVSVSAIENEVSQTNNVRKAYIEIIDSRQKILLLGAAPHPDIGAMKRTLEQIDNYEVVVNTSGTYQIDDVTPEKVSLVVLHQLPNKASDREIIQTLVSKKIPMCFVIGKRSNLSIFNQLGLGVQIPSVNQSFNTAFARPTEGFALFELKPETLEAMEEWPPLEVPFGAVSGDLEVAMNQQIGLVETKQPLLGFITRNELRMGFLLGEGFWKWSLQDYRLYENFQASSDILRNTVQYLSVKADKRRFKVKPSERVYYENDKINFVAELYNESYQLVNDPDVNLSLQNEKGEQFDFVFGRSGEGYELNAGVLPKGEYTYTSKTQLGGKSFQESGSFVIRELKLEEISLQANSNLMYRIAQNSGGVSTTMDGLDELREQLLNDPKLVSTVYTQNSFKELIHLRWLFFLILGLLTMEWGVRKWIGGY